MKRARCGSGRTTYRSTPATFASRASSNRDFRVVVVMESAPLDPAPLAQRLLSAGCTAQALRLLPAPIAPSPAPASR